MDKIKKYFRIFFSTFRKITVGGFVNQLIKKFWPKPFLIAYALSPIQYALFMIDPYHAQYFMNNPPPQFYSINSQNFSYWHVFKTMEKSIDPDLTSS